MSSGVRLSGINHELCDPGQDTYLLWALTSSLWNGNNVNTYTVGLCILNKLVDVKVSENTVNIQ